ncbi:L,D-transpeptidase family protein [Helicobacter brantae]|uniref:Peptidase n=1 Tax=Helicobacter brantae TaxID=375927 RepID=A0A3D8J0F3_9HELI|nr:peptidase [Helicobacter brantae]
MLCLIQANDFSEKALDSIVSSYRQAGWQQVEQKIQNVLADKRYWLIALQNQDIRYGYYENTSFLFISDKSKPSLSLYKVQNGQLTLQANVDALVGSGKGNKNISGDLTTPIGVYDLLNKLTKLDQYYGPMAFVTSYPNAYDKSLKKTGYGIWIHGMPLNGNRDELNTKGCIAIENDEITKFDKIIKYNNTLLITYEGNYIPPTKDEMASVLSGLFQWKDAWQKGDFNQYISFYDTNFKKPNGMGYKGFKQYKQKIFAKKEVKQINLFKVDVAPYPNEEGKKLFRITFDQDYTAFNGEKLTYRSSGRKELYVLLKPNGKISILLEE